MDGLARAIVKILYWSHPIADPRHALLVADLEADFDNRTLRNDLFRHGFVLRLAGGDIAIPPRQISSIAPADTTIRGATGAMAAYLIHHNGTGPPVLGLTIEKTPV